MHQKITDGSHRRPIPVVLLLSAALTLGLDLAPAQPQPAQPPEPAEPAPAAADSTDRLILDDVAEPLRPVRPRTPEQQDRVDAIALFSAGRSLERKERYAEALQSYQRALRLDPQSGEVARAILPVAVILKRQAVATRYAIQMQPEDLQPVHPWLVQELADRLDKQREWAGALRLYEAVAAGRAGAKETEVDVRIRMAMGRLYYIIEQYDKAADNFKVVVRALEDPEQFGLDARWKKRLLGNDGATYNLFGECYLLADRFDPATTAFQNAHAVAGDEGTLQFNLARVHARRKQPKRALKALEASFKHSLADEGLAPYGLLANVLEQLGTKDELLPRLEKLHADDPDSVPLAYYLAGKYHEADRPADAEKLYRGLVEKSPTLTGYRALIEIYHRTDRPEALLEILGKAVDDTGVLEALGEEVEAVAADDKLLGALFDRARKIHEQDPDRLTHGMRLATALLALEKKQHDTAAEFFELALEAEPKNAAETLLLWGIGLLLDEHPAEAAKVFQRAIDEKVMSQTNAAFCYFYYLSGALAMDDRTGEALAAAEKCVKLHKDKARYHARKAWVLYRAERYDEAIKAYTELVKQFDSDHASPETREVLRETRLILSALYVEKDDFAEAEEWLEQVLDEFPGDVGASNDLGYLWADGNKNLHRAVKMTRLAVDAEPENVAYRDSLGWVYYRLGRFDEAVAELEKTVEQLEKKDDLPGNAVIFDHLGDAYLKAGKSEKAKDAWRRAIELFNEEEEPEKAKQVEGKMKNEE